VVFSTPSLQRKLIPGSLPKRRLTGTEVPHESVPPDNTSSSHVLWAAAVPATEHPTAITDAAVRKLTVRLNDCSEDPRPRQLGEPGAVTLWLATRRGPAVQVLARAVPAAAV
jgi:hypothetical protein